MKEQTIPLVGSPTTRVSSGVPVYNYDQRFINCFPITTKNTITGQGSVRLNKRQGYALYQTLASSGFLGNPGACMWTGYSGGALPVFSVSNIATAKVRIYDSNGTQIGGDISNAYYCTSLTETKISGVAHLVAYIHDSAIPTVIRAYYFPEGGAWTEIADADFPPNFGTPVSLIGDPIHMNGVMIAMAVDGKLYNSDLNTLSGWTATSFLEAQRKPDAGMGLQNYKDTVIGFGQDSIEFFQYTGNATGSVLSRIPGAVINLGLPTVSLDDRRSIAIGEQIFFYGVDAKTAVMHIYRLNGYSAEIISNDAVDEYINSNASPPSSNHLVGGFKSLGLTHLMTNISFDNGGGYFCYCIEKNVWWIFKCAESFSPAAALGDYLIGNTQRKLYQHASSYQDNSITIEMTVQTDPLDQGTNRKKFFHAAELLADRRSTGGNTSISWSDDDYQNFSTARTIDLSTGSRRITRLGSTQRAYNNKRAWKITETVNAPFRGESLKLWYTEGTT